MKNIAKVLCFGGLVVGLATYASADTIWDVDAQFSYDAFSNTATGSFQLDPGLNLINWNIDVTGSNTLADNVYDTGDSIAIYPDYAHLDFYDGSTNNYIDLYLQSPLTNAGGSINLLYGNGGLNDNATIVCAGCGTLVSGKVVGSVISTPEPAAIAVVGVAGILGLVLVRRKRTLAR